MCDTEFLRNLKVGDSVYIEKSQKYEKAQVEGVTKTLVMISGRKFKRSDGFEYGHSSDNTWILRPVTPYYDDQVKRREYADEIDRKARELDTHCSIHLAGLDSDKMVLLIQKLDEANSMFKTS